jgi:hypothetical protein
MRRYRNRPAIQRKTALRTSDPKPIRQSPWLVTNDDGRQGCDNMSRQFPGWSHCRFCNGSVLSVSSITIRSSRCMLTQCSEYEPKISYHSIVNKSIVVLFHVKLVCRRDLYMISTIVAGRSAHAHVNTYTCPRIIKTRDWRRLTWILHSLSRASTTVKLLPCFFFCWF